MTPTELANMVMDKLGVNAPGEELSADDLGKANLAYKNVYAWMRRKRLATFPESDINETVSDDVALLVANRLSLDYGLSPQKRQEINFAALGRGNPFSAVQNLRDNARPLPVTTDEKFTTY